jgi:hypothetical protein
VTDIQFGALLSAVVTGLGGVALAIRWAAGRLTKAIDDNTASNVKLSDAQIAYAGSMAGMAAKLDHVADWVHNHTPVEMAAADPYATDRPASERLRAPTYPRGYRPPRPGERDE